MLELLSAVSFPRLKRLADRCVFGRFMLYTVCRHDHVLPAYSFDALPPWSTLKGLQKKIKGRHLQPTRGATRPQPQ